MEVHIHIDDRLVDAVKTVTRSFTRRRVAAIASLSVVASAFVADAAPVEPQFNFEAGQPIVAAEINKNFETLYDTINDRLIRDEQTIAVDNCEELIAELNDLEESRILPGGSVTIEIATGTHVCPDPVDLVHVDGKRLSIVGVGDSPSDVTLSFTGDGFFLTQGSVLGLLSNLTLRGGGGSTALEVSENATARVSNVVSQNFGSGFSSRSGGTLVLTNCEAVGDVGNTSGAGFTARDNAILMLTDCVARNHDSGLYAYRGGIINVAGTLDVEENVTYRAYAVRLSLISVSTSTNLVGDDKLEIGLGSFIQ